MNFLSKKHIRIGLHIGFWIALYLLLCIDAFESIERRTMLTKMSIYALLVLSFALVTYINFYFLMPKWLYKKRQILYFLALLLLIVGACFFNDWLFHVLFNTDYQVIDRIFTLLFFQSFVMGIKTLRNDAEKNKRIQELELIQAQKELQLLKSQVNPHFLFNTLNNIYALTLTDGKKASEVVLKLSELMRYMFTTAQLPSVSLKKEVDYLTNYINLEQLRLNEGAVIRFHKSGDFGSKYIAPMLLLPFVENAFKHGVETQTQNINVEIDLVLQQNDLFFQIKNTKPKVNKVEITGMGLVNIEKRLVLLYPDNHKLTIADNKGIYDLKLWITL
jgi:two-component system, LytTR family, sensor kinase